MSGSQFYGRHRTARRRQAAESRIDVRQTLAEIDPNLTVLELVSLNEQVTRNFNQDRLIARLTELFGLLALALACVGLYGVTSYSVARRTSEIGIRMALGANRTNVLALVLRGVLIQLGLGLAIGIPVALLSAAVSWPPSFTASKATIPSSSVAPSSCWPPRPCSQASFLRIAVHPSIRCKHYAFRSHRRSRFYNTKGRLSRRRSPL